MRLKKSNKKMNETFLELKEKYYSMLIETLRLLAANYETQIEVLPKFVNVPDELALIFTDTLLIVKQNAILVGEKMVIIENIDKLLEEINENKDLWTLESLKNSSKWQEVRNLASKAIEILEEENKNPEIFWINFVK